jgi:hypothetical protein
MVQWTKESALAELQSLAEATTSLARDERYSVNHTRWIARTLAFLEDVFGQNSRYYASFKSLPWHETGSMIVDIWSPELAIDGRHQKAYRKQLDMAKGMLLGAADELERKDIASVYEGKSTGPESSSIIKVLNLSAKVRKLMRDRPEREREVQNAFEDLLVGADLAYSREAKNIEYSSKTYVPDFTMPKIDLAVEIKLCNREGREKELIAEINDDILAYRTEFGNLLFLIYDLGWIRDTELFAASFEQHQNVVIRVVKH